MSFRFEQKVGKYTYVYEITSFWDKELKKSRSVAHSLASATRFPENS